MPILPPPPREKKWKPPRNGRSIKIQTPINTVHFFEKDLFFASGSASSPPLALLLPRVEAGGEWGFLADGLKEGKVGEMELGGSIVAV